MQKKYLEIITIDGPGGSGKSTVSKIVANRLHFTFLDTGAMYRAVALFAVRNDIKPVESEALKRMLKQLELNLLSSESGLKITVNSVDYSKDIRDPEVGKWASDFSKIKSVRDFCTAKQREIGRKGRVVAEGRDMGTVVFPDARWKFFITADLAVRARRRWLEEREKGSRVSYEEIFEKLKARDAQDTQRALAPLRPAEDAVIIESDTMSVAEVIEEIVRRVNSSI